MYICINIYINVFVYIHIYTCIYIYIYTYIDMCKFKYVSINIHTYTYMYICIYIHHILRHDDQELSLSGHALTEIKNLPPKLVSLNAHCNRLTAWPLLPNFEFRHLGLSGNMIGSLEGLSFR